MTAPAWTARLGARVPGVTSIAVLRGGGLGDLVFTLPAIAALRAAYPDASLELLGTPGGAALLEGRGLVDAAHPMPLVPGVRDLPGHVADPSEVERYIERMRARRFDLAVQVTGGGRNSNPFLARLAPRLTVGLQADDAPPLDRTLPYVYYQHEVFRDLEVVALVGAAVVSLEPVLPVLPGEREAARARLGRGPVVVLHPGATDPRRRWPAASFGALASALVERGVRVVVVGDGADADAAAGIAASVAPDAGERVLVLAGRQSVAELVGTLAAADVVVANDSGPRHIAQALGTPTVGVFWIGNVVNAAPLGRGGHRIRIGWTTRCPVCGIDVTQVGWTAPRCEHDPSFVADVEVSDVLADVESLLP